MGTQSSAAQAVTAECKDVMQVEPRPYGRRRELVLIGVIGLLFLVITLLVVVPGVLAA